METTLLIALGVAVVAGLLIGSRVVQRSTREKPIYGGGAARFFHYLACVAFTGGVPAALVDIILSRNILMGFMMGLGFISLSFVSLLIYGALERGPRELAEAQDRGWTAEKARSSGL